MIDPSLLGRASHFDFGKNWSSYARLVTDAHVEEAVRALRHLSGDDLRNRSFLDIGCGSGLHALAALRLGAREVLGVDLDADSVATAQEVLRTRAPGAPWRIENVSVFDLPGRCPGLFDVVYSWGVLHHTGDMYGALRAASTLVAPQGRFIFALYRRTRLCWLWKREKRWYATATPAAQARARAVYVWLFRSALALAKRRTLGQHKDQYTQRRGMDFTHDVHDWLGGWPYESITPAQTEQFMNQLGFSRVRAVTRDRVELGLLGSGCDEYVYARR
ncbi:MAG: class I SAM-dependent methyltransferase [Gammaproteobacteria bacterium]|nr:class I SAM-dependent methyltransferase [Gammaproteobacteria bacterium]